MFMHRWRGGRECALLPRVVGTRQRASPPPQVRFWTAFEKLLVREHHLYDFRIKNERGSLIQSTALSKLADSFRADRAPEAQQEVSRYSNRCTKVIP